MAQQLVLEPAQRNCEVEHRQLDELLRLVVGIVQMRAQYQLEARVVRDKVPVEEQPERARGLVLVLVLLLDDRVERRVYIVLEARDKQLLAEAEAVLKRPLQLRVRGLADLDALLLVEVLDKLLPLPFWVYQKAVLLAVEEHDRVLLTVGVRRKLESVDIVHYGHLICQNVRQLELSYLTRSLLYDAAECPKALHQELRDRCSVLRVERACVDQRSCAE